MNELKLPKIAVLLAAYNGLPWIAQQVQSILNQEGVMTTIFVSVDLSTDGTEAWVDEQTKENKRIVLLPTGKKFGGAGANFFRLFADVDFSGFDYVCLSDQDDLWVENKLLSAHDFLIDQKLDAYSSNATAFWPDGRARLVLKSQPQVRYDHVFEAAGPGCTYVFKQVMAVDLQSFVRQHRVELAQVELHDWFFYAYARVHGYRWGIDTSSYLMYRQHANNQVGANMGWRAYQARLRKFSRGWLFLQAGIIMALLGESTQTYMTQWAQNGRMGFFKLACQTSLYRRSKRDQCVLAVLCLYYGIFLPSKTKFSFK